MGYSAWGVAVALAVAILAAPAQAQDGRLSVDVDSVFVGERFTLSLAVTHPDGTTVSFPEVPSGSAEAAPLLEVGDAEVFTARRLPPRIDGSVRVDSIVYEAATFALDAAVLGPIIAQIIAGPDTVAVRSNTVRLPVMAVLPSPDADLLPPLPPERFPSPWPIWVALAVLGLGLIVLAVWLWRRRKNRARTAPRPAPYPEATQRLDRLAAIEPRTAEAIKAHYVELADLLRTYLARSLGLPALEMTTRELAEALRRDDRVPDEAASAVRGTLRLSDLVKFADLRPDPDAHTEARARARTAIDAIEAAMHPPEDDDASGPPDDGGVPSALPTHPS